MNSTSVSTLDDISFVSAEENVADLRDFDEISEILDLGTVLLHDLGVLTHVT